MKRLINDKKKKLNLVFSFLKNKNEIFKFANTEIDKTDLKNIYDAVNEEFAFNEPEALVELKNEMPIENDYVFSGTVYRKLEFAKSIFSNLEVHYNSEEDENNNVNGFYYMEDVMRAIMENTAITLVQSCTSSLEVCKNFKFYSGISVIIYFNTSDGLDVNKMCEYYKNLSIDLYNQTDDDFYNQMAFKFEELMNNFSSEQEILAQIPRGYNIYSINDVEVDNNLTITAEQLKI